MYDRAFFDHPIDRRGTACEKWDSAMARDPRVTVLRREGGTIA